MKVFFIGAWISAVLLIITGIAINGGINIWLVAWAAFTLAGWIGLTKNAGKA
jgi:hypothetical protein